ncbi:MAG: hypothetical protein ACODAE_05770 [Gemmatimonadota bacterium]
MPQEVDVQDSEQHRDGFALAAAVLALVVVGALVTGGFYAASQEARMSHATVSAERAFNFAERGLHEGLGVYQKTDVQEVDGSETEEDTTYVLEDGTSIEQGGETVGAFDLWFRRLGPNLYMLGSEGTVANAAHAAEVKRAVGVLVRTRDMNFPMNAAIQVSDEITIAGNATIDGEDHAPQDWESCDTLAPRAGLIAEDTSLVTRQGNAHDLNGDPPMDEDTTISSDDYSDFGDFDFDGLAAAADINLSSGDYSSIGPVDVDGVCDTSGDTNWGAPEDPDDPCHLYFPTIYRDGDLSIAGHNAGQGILLVDGDLQISGGFEFYGIVIVNGSLSSTGTGGHLNGVVMVAGGATLDTDSTTTDDDESTTSGNSIINFSSCAVQRARDYNGDAARLVPIRDRAWLDLSAVGSDGGDL